jgi:Arc/MetJ family transcription regulator
MRKLLEKRTAVVAEMRALTASPAGDGGDLSAEQETRFNALKARVIYF